MVGLRTYLDERFGLVDERFEHQDRMLDAFATEVQSEFDRHAATLQDHGRMLHDHGRMLHDHGRMLHDHGRKLDALLAHFHIDPPDA